MTPCGAFVPERVQNIAGAGMPNKRPLQRHKNALKLKKKKKKLRSICDDETQINLEDETLPERFMHRNDPADECFLF